MTLGRFEAPDELREDGVSASDPVLAPLGLERLA
jgi:hypothetical protein